MTDEGLKQLKQLTRLEVLNLWGTRVTNAGLVQLQELQQLRELHLGKTAVRQGGLKHLSGLPQPSGDSLKAETTPAVRQAAAQGRSRRMKPSSVGEKVIDFLLTPLGWALTKN